MIHELFPYLCVGDAARAIDWYSAIFGAKEKFRLTEPSGRIGHAELEFGTITLMLCEEYPELKVVAPDKVNGTSMSIHLHVDNADALIGRAVEAGATLDMAPTDHFYGERSGTIHDPFGHRWNIGHSIENVEPAEMQRRYDAIMKGT
jgi:PhnB protein